MTSRAVGSMLLMAAAMAVPGAVRAQAQHDRAGAMGASPAVVIPPPAMPGSVGLFTQRHRPPAETGTVAVLVPPQVPPDRWLAPDKLRHFFLSFGATGVSWATLDAAGAGASADWLAPSLTMVAGLAKEIVDHGRGWGFSLKDLVWDAAGVLVAVIAMRETG